MQQIPRGKMLKTQGNHSKNREFCLDRSVSTLLKCLQSFKYHFVSHRLAIYAIVKVKLQNLFLINFEWFVDLCVVWIILLRLKGILIFHEVTINEQKVLRDI